MEAIEWHAVVKRWLVWVSALLVAGLAWHSAVRAQTGAIPPEDRAPVAYMVDISSGQVLYARNERRRFVPASITKVMTLMLAFELIEEGKLDPDRIVTISEGLAEEWSGTGSSMRLEAGDEVSIHDLLIGIATVSANDGSIALADAALGSVDAWTKAMTAKARDLGLEESHFATPNGWPDEGQTFVTAHDLSILAEAMIAKHPGKYATYIGRPEFTYNDRTGRNYDPITGQVEGADGIKTGFTNEAGFGFLGSAKRGDQRLVMVLAGAYRRSDREELSRSFMEWGFSAFDRRALFGKGDVVAPARVQNGSRRKIDLVTDREIVINVPKQSAGELTIQVTYDGPLRAPIQAGERVAMLEITAPDMAPASIPLVARSSVAQAGFFDRIINAVTELFS